MAGEPARPIRGKLVKSAQSEFVSACGSDPSFVEDVRLYVSQVEVFRDLQAHDLGTLIAIGKAVTYSPEEVIFEQGSAGDSLHVVLSGKVLLLGRVSEGTTKVVGERNVGESFGEISLLTESNRNLSAIVEKGEESLQLIFCRNDFLHLVERHPNVGFKVYSQLVSSIHERLDPLPPYFRNLVLWGYKPAAPSSEPSDEDELIALSKPAMLGTSGLLVGTGIFLLLRWVLKTSSPELYSALSLVRMAIVGLLVVLANGVTGFLIGMYYDTFERKFTFGQTSSRCCANCKFVTYNDNSGNHGCMFASQPDLKVNFKLGQRNDTFTDCSSFEAGEGRTIKARTRDTMAKD